MIPKQPTIHHCCLSSNIPACIQHIRLNTFPFNTQIDNTFPFNTLFREDGVAAHFSTLMPVSELVKPVVVVVVDVVVAVISSTHCVSTPVWLSQHLPLQLSSTDPLWFSIETSNWNWIGGTLVVGPSRLRPPKWEKWYIPVKVVCIPLLIRIGWHLDYAPRAIPGKREHWLT